MMKHSFIIPALILIAAISAVSCRHHASELSYHWNKYYEYGALYPAIFGEIDHAQNGKGFSVGNGESTLWADCYLMRLCGDSEEDLREEYAINRLNGGKGPVVVLDTTFVEGTNIIMNKVIAYYGVDPLFYEINCSYPSDKEEVYGELYRKCVSEFPSFKK